MKHFKIAPDEYIIKLEEEYYVINEFTFQLLENIENENTNQYIKQHGMGIRKFNQYIKEINAKIANPEFYGKNLQLRCPLKIQWKITNSCNLKCLHCYTEANEFASRDLGHILLKKIASDIISAGIMEVTISGGEALMVDKIEDIVSMLLKSGISVRVFTNGMLLKEFIDKMPHEAHTSLSFSVSIDGNETIHDEIRGKGTFKKCVEGIKYALEQDYKLVTNTVIMKKNIKDICQLIRYLNEVGVEQVQLSNLIVKGRADANMQITSEERKELLNSLKNIVNDIGMAEILYAEVPDDQDNSKIYEVTEKGNKFIGYENWKCSAGIGKATIDSEGNLLCCPFVESSKLGNVLEETIVELWAKNKRLEFLKVLQKENNNSRRCLVIRE